MKLRTIRQLGSLKGKKVLLRVAYDVPLKKKGAGWAVADDRRIRETLPTIQSLLKKGASIALMSWLGRPGGQVVTQYRMEPVSQVLAQLLKRQVDQLSDCAGPEVVKRIERLKPGQIVMLENVRFRPQEERKDLSFALELTRGFDLVVFDAFAQAHRDVPSVTGILRYLPSYAGLLVEREVEALARLLNNPKRPFIVIIGGAKISDKVPVIERLAPRADAVLVGGGVANVFTKAKGIPIGKSLVEESSSGPAGKQDVVSSARRILKKFGSKIVLPIDFVSASRDTQKAQRRIVRLEEGEPIRAGWRFLDIGPETRHWYCALIAKSKTVFWNGPVGLFELAAFSRGTTDVARAVAKVKAFTVLGGGDTEIVVSKHHLEGKFDHVSTGGGASLEFLARGTLPALQKLIIKN